VNGAMSLAVPVDLNDHVLGPSGAAVTLVEYGDYESTDCGMAYLVIRTLQREFGGTIRFVFRNFPMAILHPQAQIAAHTAEAVAQQGQFWEIHDLLFEHQNQLTESSLLGYAYEAGADVQEVVAAIASGEPGRRVRNDVAGGVKSGVTAAPAFFINGVRYQGEVELIGEYLRANDAGSGSDGE